MNSNPENEPVTANRGPRLSRAAYIALFSLLYGVIFAGLYLKYLSDQGRLSVLAAVVVTIVVATISPLFGIGLWLLYGRKHRI